MPTTLHDGHSQAHYVRANLQNRDGIVGRFDPRPRLNQMPDPERHIQQLQPWVRQLMASQDLLFTLGWDGASSARGQARCTLTSVTGENLVTIERPKLGLFQTELTEVAAMADLRAERTDEILAQIDHQWAHWASILPLRPDLKPRTLELAQSLILLCVSIEMRFKQVLGVWRPIDLSPQIQPIITTPGHGSFPMGHATQAYATAELLKLLLGLGPTDTTALQLERQAHRIAVNRIIAGVHFPVDLVAGQLLGKALAQWAHACAMTQPVMLPIWHFTESAYRQAGPWAGLAAQDPTLKAFQAGQTLHIPKAARLPVWNQLWRQAKAEWEGTI